MNTAAHPRPNRPSEGAASVDRLHEAWRTGALPFAVPARGFGPMTADPLRLDDGIPTLTQRQADRHHRNAPHLHLVHRVDTETDLPDGMAGVAIGHTALPEAHTDPLQGDTYQPRTVGRRRSKVDPVLRSRVWRTLIAVYLVAAAACAWAWLA